MSFKKLTVLLKALDPPTRKRLSEYLNTPYFNVPAAALLLYNYCSKFHPIYDKINLLPDTISQVEKRLGDKNKQAKAATDLCKAIDHFLSLEQWQSKSKTQSLYLMQAYSQVVMPDLMEDTVKKILKKLEGVSEKDIDYYEYKHLLTEISLNGFTAKLQRNKDNNLQPVVDTLHTFYAVKMLRYHCELLNRRQVLGINYVPGNISTLMQMLSSMANINNPYLFLFVNIYWMMQADTYKNGRIYYQRIHQYITKQSGQDLSQGERECVDYLINYFLYWGNQGEEDTAEHALNWYQFKIDKNCLLSNNLIQPSDFRGIVSLAINSLKKAEWIKKFIDTYSPHLPKEHKQINFSFANAQYNYYIKNYGEAINLFEKIKTRDEPIFNMILRRWHFMCIYEQDADNKDALISFLTNWERQMYRNVEELHGLKKIFGKMISYSRKLVDASQRIHKLALIAELDIKPHFTGKNWLLQQLKK